MQLCSGVHPLGLLESCWFIFVRVQASRFRGSFCLWFRVMDFGFNCMVYGWLGLNCVVYGSGFNFKVYGLWFKFRVWGLGFQFRG